MRAALFGPVKDDSEAMGALTETAIYSQWFHSAAVENLYYARWKTGEVDLVYLLDSSQQPIWCIEVKWSDLPYTDKRKINSLIEFLQMNNLTESMVTTKTIKAKKEIDLLEIDFKPSSLHTYSLGANLHERIERRGLS